MIKSKKICWFLRIEETKNLRFCQRYLNTNELDLENNKRIIDKLAEENIEEICWIGNEMFNYPYSIELIKYAKQKNIHCELLINNNCDIEKLKSFIEVVDSITVTMNFIDTTISKEFENIFNIRMMVQDRIKFNILTMVNSKNVLNKENISPIIRWLNINNLIILSFMPILLNSKEDVELLKVSKIKFRVFSDSFTSFLENVDSIYRFSDYTITRRFRIILPNGDITVINENESFLIGNLLKDDKDRIEKNYNNKRKNLIPKKREQKVKVVVADNDEEIINKVVNEIKDLNYVEIIGISRCGKDTYEEIINKKPDMVFLKNDFKDIPAYELISKIVQKLKLETPIFNLLGIEPTEDEVKELVRNPYKPLNAVLGNYKDYEGCCLNIIKQYKEYRDED